MNTMNTTMELNEMELDAVCGGNILKSIKRIAVSNYKYWGVEDAVDAVKDTAKKIWKKLFG